jgi:hypothetical protein
MSAQNNSITQGDLETKRSAKPLSTTREKTATRRADEEVSPLADKSNTDNHAKNVLHKHR